MKCLIHAEKHTETTSVHTAASVHSQVHKLTPASLNVLVLIPKRNQNWIELNKKCIMHKHIQSDYDIHFPDSMIVQNDFKRND